MHVCMQVGRQAIRQDERTEGEGAEQTDCSASSGGGGVSHCMVCNKQASRIDDDILSYHIMIPTNEMMLMHAVYTSK